MKRLLPIIFLLCAAQTLAQVPLDSAYWDTEMEDSVSSLFIKNVEHPEELLMQALVRLEKDLKYKHSKREYRVEAIFNPWTSPTFNFGNIIVAKAKGQNLPVLTCRRTFTVEGDNGMDIMNHKYAVKGPLSVELPYFVPVTLEDSTNIESTLSNTSYENELHVEVNGSKYKQMEIYDLFTYFTLEKIYKSILRVYDVSAYYISNNIGGGMYRIHLDEKKKQKTRMEQLYYENRKMKWYLDRQSLRLTQVNGVRHDNEHVTMYRNDFGEENGTPILKKATKVAYFGDRVHRTAIQLIE